jgi:hypothetical protein
LGITREDLQELTASVEPAPEYQHPSLQERLHQIRTLADGIGPLVQRRDDARKELAQVELELQAVRTRLVSLQDDLMGDMMNGCFPECRIEGN